MQTPAAAVTIVKRRASTARATEDPSAPETTSHSMDAPSSPLAALADLPPGSRGRIVEIRAGRELARRLLGLGLRLGSEITVLHHRGRGVVVSNGDARVALGGGVAEKLWIEPLA